MKYNCDLIEDLLPLYKDGICSESSKKIVEEHLTECPDCSKMLNMLNDTLLDDEIKKEKEEVLDSQARFFKRKSAVAGGVIAGFLAVPIIICLIVDLFNGSGLSWFFIVLAAMFIPASLFVVPLMAVKNKLLMTICSFTGSILFLLGVCSIYTRGTWFFVAAPAVLFGLTIIFAPFVVAFRPVRDYVGSFKGLIIMAAYSITYTIMMICIGLYVKEPGYFSTAFGVSAPILGIIWIIFLIIRYLRVNGFIKAGIVISIITTFAFCSNTIIGYLIRKTAEAGTVTVYSNPSVWELIIGIVIGLIFLGIGIIRWKLGGEK